MMQSNGFFLNNRLKEIPSINFLNFFFTLRREQTSRKKDAPSNEELDRRRRPLLPKSSICRLLAELVRSYAGCARLVAEHVFPVKTVSTGAPTEVSEETSALAFLLDYLLPTCQTAGDKDCPALVRTLVASLASCNHAPEAQSSLVAEVKGALNRALAMPESNDKHIRLQSLTALLSTMIERYKSFKSSSSFYCKLMIN